MMSSRLPLVAFSVLLLSAPLYAQTHPLPRTGEFIDSTAFAAFVQAHAAGDRGTLLLSITVDSAGRVESVRTLEAKLPPALTALLSDSLPAYARPQAPWRSGRWWLRLALEVGPTPAVRTQRSQITAPSRIGAPPLDPNVAAAIVRAGSVDASYRVLVAADGSVLRIEPGPSTLPVLVEELRRDAHLMRYRPGKVDGSAQPMWLEEHSRMEVRVVPMRR